MRHDRFEGDEALDDLTGRRPLTTLLIVMLAGAAGVGLRYVLDAAITSRAGDGFPWSTLTINLLGAFAIGVALALLAGQGPDTLARPAIAIGLLGGFTTFSALAIETVTLVEDGMAGRAALYVAATNTLGIGAAAVGLIVGRALPPG